MSEAEAIPVPRKRRWSFSLRTLFVLVTLTCCWMGYQLNWIRQRHAFLAEQTAILNAHNFERPSADSIEYCDAPGLLWVFGERGRADVYVWVDVGPDTPLTASDLERVARARRLFPETSPLVVNSWAPGVKNNFDPDGRGGNWSGPVPETQ